MAHRKALPAAERKGMGPLGIVFMSLVYIFLYMPIVVVVLYSFNENASSLTYSGFTLYWYKVVFQGDPLWRNMLLSLELAFVSMVISVVLGTLATIGMYRYDFKLKKYLDGLMYIPLVIPELVIGVASLAAFTRMGISLGFATMVFAHVTFCLPFVIITLRARIADFDASIEEAAMDLGANQWHTLKRVTLPLLTPGIISGAFMSVSLSIDDVIISSFVAGAGEGTFPVKVYGMVRGKISTQVYVMSTILLVSVVLIYVISRLIMKFWRARHASD